MRFDDIISKTDELEFINHLMRTGKISSNEFCIMMEAHHCLQKRLLLENANKDHIRFFQTNSGIEPIIGKEYWIIPVHCIGDQVYVYDSSFVNPPQNKPAKRKLVAVDNTSYKIKVNNKVVDFPNKRLTPMAYGTVIFFDDSKQYNKLALSISIAFDIELPRIP